MANVTVHYMECTTAPYQSDIDMVVQWAVASIPADIQLGNIEVYVFDKDFETLAALENQSTRSMGFDVPSVEQLRKDWGDGGGLAGADGKIFIYFGKWWRNSERTEQIKTVVHEIHHIGQYRASSKNNFWSSKFPVWFPEGFAEYYARKLVSKNHVKPLDHTETLNRCHLALKDMSDWKDIVDENCMYTQGTMAGKLFDLLFGEDEYWAIWKGLKYNKFEFEFKQVTGITVAQFGDMYDSFRLSNYTKVPALPRP